MARPGSNRQRALDIVKGWEHRFGKIGSGRNALLRDIEWALRNTEDRAWEGGSMQAKYRQKAEIEALVARARQAAEQVCWAVDMTSGGAGLLLAVLAAAEQKVVYVP